MMRLRREMTCTCLVQENMQRDRAGRLGLAWTCMHKMENQLAGLVCWPLAGAGHGDVTGGQAIWAVQIGPAKKAMLGLID